MSLANQTNNSNSDFKVGDVVVINEEVSPFDDIFTIINLRVTAAGYDLANLNVERFYTDAFCDEIRHATDAEKVAGHRLNPIQSMGDDKDIKNHVSHHCITNSDEQEDEADYVQTGTMQDFADHICIEILKTTNAALETKCNELWEEIWEERSLVRELELKNSRLQERYDRLEYIDKMKSNICKDFESRILKAQCSIKDFPDHKLKDCEALCGLIAQIQCDLGGES